MTRSGFKTTGFSLLAVCGAMLALVYFPSSALGHTCGSNWCSGSDGTTSSNIQTNGPQVYIGEVGTYGDDFYGDSGVAWSNTGANDAMTRYGTNGDGSGIGVEDYYFGGGPYVDPGGYTDTCWGAKQAFKETYHMYVNYNKWWPVQYMSFIDIEDPIADYGWSSTDQSGDRAVFDGWWDYIAGEDTCGYGANANDVTQQGVYSSPDAWNNAMTGSIDNTYEWTYAKNCYDAWPGSSWGGRAQWFGSSDYDWALQFESTSKSCKPAPADWDDAYEPDTLPELNDRQLGS